MEYSYLCKTQEEFIDLIHREQKAGKTVVSEYEIDEGIVVNMTDNQSKFVHGTPLELTEQLMFDLKYQTMLLEMGGI